MDDAQMIRRLGAAVVEAVRAAGGPTAPLEPVGTPTVTARSTLYTFGRRGAPAYVVKIPVMSATWVDTEPVLPAAQQFAALERAYSWQLTEDRHAVARPVALLADREAIVMDHVAGATVADRLRWVALRPADTRRAVAAAGDFLRRFHAHGRGDDAEIDLERVAAEIDELIAGPMGAAGIPVPSVVARAVRSGRDRRVTARTVLLHGDFVPSNLVVTGRDQVTMLDPALDRVDWAVQDLARFLAVLSSDSAFVPGVVLTPIRRLRQGVERAFRAAYRVPVSEQELLELALIQQLLLRWARRRVHSRLGADSRAMRVRRGLIDRHMSALVVESADRLRRGRREDLS